MLSDEDIVEINYKKLKRSVNEPTIFAKVKIVASSKNIEMFMEFTFKDMDIRITGKIERSMLIEIEDMEEEVAIAEIIESGKENLCQPLFAKASKIVADISDEAFLFPLIVPTDEWHEGEESEITIIEK